ncbi:YcaO-like family protein [Nonomuraea sp. NPDC050556]|uniref:YcaO-like family protein n=1 Tax=Nonomuraea sp. NPDC050556 TaxID=3364369 RepID=UPI0037BDDE4B
MSALPFFERSVSPEDAHETARQEIARLECTLEISSHGFDPYRTHYVTLIDSSETVVSRASGKGRGEQGILSGTFEAIEHYYSAGYTVAADSTRSSVLSTPQEIADQSALREVRMIKSLASDYPKASMGAVHLKRWDEDIDDIDYPLFLFDAMYASNPLPGDKLEYRDYLGYQGSSGSAAGINDIDAVIHAVCEIIERDAFSLSLIDWFASRQPEFRLINLASLPSELHQLVEHARAAAGDVLLLEMTTEIGVPAFLAIQAEQEELIRLYGLGCSISSIHAVERALTELIQGCHAATMDPDFERTWSTRLKKSSQWAFYHDIVKMNLEASLSRGMHITKDLDLVRTPDSANSTMRELISRLSRNNMKVYWRRISPPEAHVSVVSVAIPGLDSFCTAAMGSIITPTSSRGWSQWTSAFDLQGV